MAEDIPVCNLGSYICVKRTMGMKPYKRFYKKKIIIHFIHSLDLDYQIMNVSACFCPERCNHTWYKNEATLGVYPNPVTDYPPSILKRAPFNQMTSVEFHKYAQ